MKNNFGVYFNLLLLSGIVLILSSCAREKGMVSYHNEKLKKQSLEIENTQTSANTLVSADDDKASLPTIRPENEISNRIAASNNTKNSNLTTGNEINGKRISPFKTSIVKKIAKKLDTNKTNSLDRNLKLAIIFGAIGLTLMLFGYPIWLVGAIIFIVGVVFLLLWVVEQ